MITFIIIALLVVWTVLAIIFAKRNKGCCGKCQDCDKCDDDKKEEKNDDK